MYRNQCGKVENKLFDLFLRKVNFLIYVQLPNHEMSAQPDIAVHVVYDFVSESVRQNRKLAFFNVVHAELHGKMSDYTTPFRVFPKTQI